VETFTGAIDTGKYFFTSTSGPITSFTGHLVPSATVASGVLTMMDVFPISPLNRFKLDRGIATLDVEGVPEPDTLGLLELGLLGNGLFGLVGMARRKLKLGA
jgi:hypothetical protein